MKQLVSQIKVCNTIQGRFRIRKQNKKLKTYGTFKFVCLYSNFVKGNILTYSKSNLTHRGRIIISAFVIVAATFLILGLATAQSVNGGDLEDPTEGFNIHVTVGRHDSAHLDANMDHFCKLTPPIVATCLLFAENAEEENILSEVEYIITRDQYLQLPLRERQNWHDHAVELTPERGMPQCISLPRGLDCNTLVSILHGTYGKVVTLWDPFDQLPSYPPYVFLVDSPYALQQDLNHGLHNFWPVGDENSSSAHELPGCSIIQAGPCDPDR